LLASALAAGCATAPEGQIRDAPADPKATAAVDRPAGETATGDITLKMHVLAQPAGTPQDEGTACQVVAKVVRLDDTGPRPLRMHVFSGKATGCASRAYDDLSAQRNAAR
jgi:hypothetical protein